MTAGYVFWILGGVAHHQRVGPFADVPPEIRIPHAHEHPLLDHATVWKVDRYFPSLFVEGVFCYFSTVEPNADEQVGIRERRFEAWSS